MAKIALPYGQETVEFEYDDAEWQVLAPPDSDIEPLSQTDILVEMANPDDGQPLEEIIDIGERVVIVVSDATRATGSERVVPLLVGRLLECGLRLNDISILFATGIHRLTTEAEKRRLITDKIFDSIKCFDHHPEDSTELVYLDDTRFGTRVELNRRLVEADHVIITGAIGFHYFAGFTGGRKSILPGLAAKSTIEQNHLLALDFTGQSVKRRAGVGAGRLDSNPVHEDMREACSFLAPSFAINTILNEHQEIVQIFCGDWFTTHRRGCAEYANRHTIAIPEKRQLVIASCGGWPRDINLIQAHKALDFAVSAVQDGGDIVLLAECQQGLGRDDLLNWFAVGNVEAIANKLSEQYQINGQTAWALANKTERFRVTLVSQLPPEQVKKMGMIPANSLSAALSGISKNLSGYLIPFATEIIPVVKK